MGLANEVPEGADVVGPQAQASFGIVADGVKGVELAADDGSHQAIVDSNAFLYVAERPKVGTRVRKVFAIDRDGRKLPVSFQSAPSGAWDLPAPAHDRATGPARVERMVEGGSIGWVVRREERGDEPPTPLEAESSGERNALAKVVGRGANGDQVAVYRPRPFPQPSG